MILSVARIFTIRSNNFRRRLIWHEPQNRSRLHVHYGGSDYDGSQLSVSPEKLGVLIDGSYVVLHRRIRECLCVFTDLHSIFLKTHLENKTSSICNLSHTACCCVSSRCLSIRRDGAKFQTCMKDNVVFMHVCVGVQFTVEPQKNRLRLVLS